MKKIIFILMMVIGFGAKAAGPCLISNSTLPSLDKVYKEGNLRIFYSNNPANENYIPYQTDLNNNNRSLS